MNKLNLVISEIGVIETALNVVKYDNDIEIIDACNKYMPFPDKLLKERVDSIIEHINNLHKEKIMIITPEIALISQIINSNSFSEILICIPTDIDVETLERITNNLAYDSKVKIIDSNTFPKDFTSSNAIIVAVGYADEGKAIILRENYKMMNIYKNFYGMRILISCQSDVSNERPIGWIPINVSEFFTHICTERGVEGVY